VVYLLDVNREKKVIRATQYPYPFQDNLPFGTILYGTLLENRSGEGAQPPPLRPIYDKFVVEDIYWFCGIPMKKMKMVEKMVFLERVMICLSKWTTPFRVFLPSIWQCTLTESGECPSSIPANITCYLAYQVHHIQYRAAYQVMPFLNVTPSMRGGGGGGGGAAATSSFVSAAKPPPPPTPAPWSVTATTPGPPHGPPPSPFVLGIPMKADFRKPQYRHPAIFQVKADVQYDIYHLFAYGRNKQPAYYNVAYVPTYRSSVFLNSLFRKIRENKNLDYIEESDDEADFENMAEDKYVDTEKVLTMECVFHVKFHKWIPTRVVSKGTKVTHVNLL
jgi:hypothetical protein